LKIDAGGKKKTLKNQKKCPRYNKNKIWEIKVSNSKVRRSKTNKRIQNLPSGQGGKVIRKTLPHQGEAGTSNTL